MFARPPAPLAAWLLLVAAACGDAVQPGPQYGVRITSADASDTIDTRLTVTALALGTDGLPVPGVEIAFQESRADGDSTAPPTLLLLDPLCCYGVVRDTTDRNGRASVVVRLGPAAAAGLVIARAPGSGGADTARLTTLPGAPVAIAVSPRDRPIAVGASYQLGAKLIDRLGNAVPGTPTFATDSSAIQLSAGGLVTGSAVGRARVAIHIAALSDSAFASVVPPGTLALRDFSGFVGDSTGYGQMDIDGSHYRLLANTDVMPSSYAPSNALQPAWIPGTSQFIHLRTVDGVSRLFVGDSTGAARRLIPNPGSITGEIDPDVSPDGAWVYFVGYSAAGDRLWRVATSGGTPESLATSAVGMRAPSVSPDGDSLVYAASMPGDGTYHVYVHDLTTGADHLVSANEAAGTRWSPTNEWILYAVSGAAAGYSGHLRLVRPDGTGDHELSAGAYFPGGAWSPDGRFVLVIRADGNFPPELIDVATGVRLPLVYQRIWYGPAWRR
jgi:WD40 repeat protein